jgi:hypothetical protein
MKKLLLALVIILIIGGIYVYNNPAWRGYFERQRDKVVDKVEQTTLYKWQDADGQWQVSDKKPPAGVDYKVLHYDRNTNVLPKKALTGAEE